ncbi:MAG: DNA polymerase III subunit delta [Oscillospiraceae bacterium]|nr:DNA polymerase III subunit delta [Oscillospiraceae bacterium]
MAAKKNDSLLKLKKQIKDGKLSPLYLFYGEEDFRKDFYVKKVVERIPDGGFPEFNHIKLNGADVPFSEYDDAWESFPMMTDKKLIHIKDSGIFKPKRAKEDAYSTDELKAFWTEKFKRISDDTVVIFDETSVDKRSSLYKALLKSGTAVEFNYLSEAELVTWVVKQCLDAKKKMSKQNAYYLITLCDPGLNNINNELQKLFDFCDKEIYKSDIDRVVSKSIQVIVFKLTDAIMAGDTRTAAATLMDLKNTDKDAFPVIYLMFSTFEKMLRVKLMRGATQGEIAAKLGVSAYIARKYIDSAAGFGVDSLAWMTRRVAEIDLAIKEGRIEDWAALEQYVTECIWRARKNAS